MGGRVRGKSVHVARAIDGLNSKVDAATSEVFASAATTAISGPATPRQAKERRNRPDDVLELRTVPVRSR